MKNSGDFSDCNTLVYGHNMKNGSMFGHLKKFREDDKLYKQDKYFWILTPERNYRYEIISAYTTGVNSDTYTLFKGPGEEFEKYLETIKGYSEIQTDDTDLTIKDKIVTLSTCTGNESTRFVVQGKRVDAEDADGADGARRIRTVQQMRKIRMRYLLISQDKGGFSMDEKIMKLQELIDGHDNIVFFGGAGVSTESGIPDFRSQDGLYHQKYDFPPETILSHSFFLSHPDEFYKFYRDKMLCDTAKPNAAHLKLAELEKAGKLKSSNHTEYR